MQYLITSPAGRKIGILTPAEGVGEQELRRLMRKPGRIQAVDGGEAVDLEAEVVGSEDSEADA